MAAPSSPDGLEFVVFAFDGIPDQVAGTEAPQVAFANALATCVQSKRIGIDVVAFPQGFSYYYVLSADGFQAYGSAAARRLKELAERQGGTSSGIVLRLTGLDDLRPEGRASIADAKVTLVEESQRDESLRVRTHGVFPLTSIETVDWLKSKEPHWAAWRLTWNTDPKAWQSIATVGTILRAPEVWINQALKGQQNGVLRIGSDVTVREMTGNCPSASFDFNAETRASCELPTATLYQAVAATSGAVEFELVRDEKNARFEDGTLAPGAVKNRLIRHDDEFRWALARSGDATGGPLLRLALVSPGLAVDPCAEGLRESVQGVTGNSDRVGSLDPECSDSLIAKLHQAFTAARSVRFPCADPLQIGACCDMRCGMRTLAEAIVFVAKALASARSTTPQSNTGPFTLAAVQVTYECEAQ